MVQLPAPLYIPDPSSDSQHAAWVVGILDASGEKIAYIFRCPRDGTLDSFEFCLGAASNPQDLKVSFQDMDAATGDADGTADQFRVVPSGSVTANSWIAPGLITSDGTDSGSKRTVAAGDMLTCVVEFNSTVGNVQVRVGRGHHSNHRIAIVRHFTGSWALLVTHATMALKYATDGYVPIGPVDIIPAAARTGLSFNSGSTTNERGLIFQLPMSVGVIGLWASAGPQADGGDYNLTLYDTDGSTVLGSSLIDGNRRYGGVNVYCFTAAFDRVTLAANTTYRMTIKPSSASNVAVNEVDVTSTALMAAMPMGANWYRSVKTSGSWVETTTSWLPMGLVVDQIDVGSGGGVAGMRHVRSPERRRR
jgi:hypothetical protein